MAGELCQYIIIGKDGVVKAVSDSQVPIHKALSRHSNWSVKVVPKGQYQVGDYYPKDSKDEKK